MKRTLSILLACIMLFGAVCAAYADDEPFDLAYVKENPSAYSISVNAQNDCAFITSTLTVAQRSFKHKDSSDSWFSYFEHDILILEYLENTRYPVFRLWPYLCTENTSLPSPLPLMASPSRFRI